MIPYGRQEISQQDIDAVIDVLKSDYLTQGEVGPKFESEVAGYCNVTHGRAVNSGTSALHVACLALGVGPGDRVWTSPITFVATPNSARLCGADVDFVDIEPATCNMSVPQLKKKLIAAKTAGQLPRVVIPVHMSGYSCDMLHIRELSREFGFSIIEDAAHAIGGCYQGKPVGSCEYSDAAVFSFHPVKIITTAEGGMVLTNSQEIADKVSLFRSHGVTRSPDLMTRKPDGPWYYQQIALGCNYRMTDVQAALGISQMKRLDEFVKSRHRLADRYRRLLADVPVVMPAEEQEIYSGMHLFVIQLKLECLSKSRRHVFTSMREQGIGVNVHFIPVHLQPYYQGLGFRRGDFPVAEQYYERAISLPMYPGLSDREQEKVVTALARSIQ